MQSASPLKGKLRSTGVPKDIRRQLAQHIKELGGPFEFDKDGKESLIDIIRKEPYCDFIDKKVVTKKQLQNLVDSWKHKATYKNKEEWLAKYYIPICLSDEEACRTYYTTTTIPPEACSTTNATPSQESTVPPVFVEEEVEKQSSPPPKEKTPPTKKVPRQNNNTMAIVDELGKRWVVPLSGGLILVIIWVDMKLSNMEVSISEDGLSIIKVSAKPNPKDAAELLSNYPWASDSKNFVVATVNGLLNNPENGIRPEPGERDEEVLAFLDEEVMREFVDINGSPTGDIRFHTDAAGRQKITFFLKTMKAHQAENAKKAGRFRNYSPTGMHVGGDSASAGMYEEETIDDRASAFDDRFVKLQEQMAKQQAEQAESQRRFEERLASQQAQMAEQQARRDEMFMRFMQMNMNAQSQPFHQPSQPHPMPQPSMQQNQGM